MDAANFVATLLPNVKYAMEGMSNPEAREVATDCHKILESINTSVEPAPKAEFEAFTGLPLERVEAVLAIARTKELIEDLGDSWQLTPLGHRYLNVLLELFMDE